MTYNHFRYARRIDSDNLGIYHNDNTKLLQLDKGTANKLKLYSGLSATGDDFLIYPNTTDTYPNIEMRGASYLILNSASEIEFKQSNVQFAVLNLENNGGILYLHECTTPTAKSDYGAIYAKSDNKLYFQDGAGVEHTVTIS